MFGFYQAFESIVKQKEAYLTEGYPDVVSAHRMGITNVIAPGGTAFTEEQARLLKRHADKLIFVYDADKGGISSAKRMFQKAFGAGFDISYVLLPPGLDLDDVCRKYSLEEVKSILSDRMDVVEFYLKNSPPQTGPDSKLKSLDELITFFSEERSPTRKMMWIRHAGEKLGIDPRDIEERCNEIYLQNAQQNNTGQNASQIAARPALLEISSMDMNVELIGEYFVANLLTVPVENRRHYFELLNPKDIGFLPQKILEPYTVLYDSFHAGHELFMSALAPQGHQQDLFESSKIADAWNAYKRLHAEGRIAHLPYNIFRHLKQKMLVSLKSSANALLFFAKEEKKTRLLSEIRVAESKKRFSDVEHLTELLGSME